MDYESDDLFLVTAYIKSIVLLISYQVFKFCSFDNDSCLALPCMCRNPGSTPEWLGNAIVAIYIAVIICLTLVYLLSCVHFSGFYLSKL